MAKKPETVSPKDTKSAGNILPKSLIDSIQRLSPKKFKAIREYITPGSEGYSNKAKTYKVIADKPNMDAHRAASYGHSLIGTSDIQGVLAQIYDVIGWDIMDSIKHMALISQGKAERTTTEYRYTPSENGGESIRVKTRDTVSTPTFAERVNAADKLVKVAGLYDVSHEAVKAASKRINDLKRGIQASGTKG